MNIYIHQPRVSYYVGGDELISLDQARILSKNNKVTIVTTKTKESEIFRRFQKNNPKVKVFKFELPDICKKKHLDKYFYDWTLESLFFGEKLSNFYLKEKPDLVATHFVMDSLFIPKRIRNVLHLHGVPPLKMGFEKELYNESLAKPKAFVAVADYIKNGWEELFPFLKEKPVYMIPNGVNINKFKPKNVEKNIDVLYVGRLIQIKGVKTLIDALKIVRKEKEDLRTVIAGEGPEKNNINSYIKLNKLEKNVELAGYIKDEELPLLYNRSKIFVAPSYAREGILGTLLEAMSCGLPSIASDCCGLTEAITDNLDGKLFKPKNSKDLAEKILFLICDGQERKKLGEKAREKVIKKFDYKDKIKELMEIYQNV